VLIKPFLVRYIKQKLTAGKNCLSRPDHELKRLPNRSGGNLEAHARGVNKNLRINEKIFSSSLSKYFSSTNKSVRI
jgi:hypothetical protein